jgi:hypothetical protein
MSAVFAPLTTTNLLINTLCTSKIVYLPAISTVGQGKLYHIKDICGNAARSSIFISTTGLDTIENRFRPSTLYALMSTNFQSVLLASDGALNWMVLQNYNANVVPKGGSPLQPNLPATPSVYLIASQYSGTGAWVDNSPNGRNATIENGTAALNAARNGIVLNGSTNWAFTDINVGNAWTCEVWYRNTGSIVGTNPCIVTQIFTGNHINICLGYGANIGFSYHQGGVGWRQGTSITITNAPWTHYVGTWNGTTITTYINGVLQGTTTPGGTASSSGANYRIGRRWDIADYMVGEVGEVRIYPVAINATQVSTDYNFTRVFYGV